MRKHLLAFGLALAFPTDASAGEVYGPPEPKPFIMPEPEPDPLVEAVQEVWIYAKDAEHMPELRAGQLRQALAARGYKIERIEQ